MSRLVGWRYGVFIGCFMAGLGAFFYPILIHPMMNMQSYQEDQKKNRAGLVQEDIQPGNMKVWSDPFDEPKAEKRIQYPGKESQSQCSDSS